MIDSVPATLFTLSYTVVMHKMTMPVRSVVALLLILDMFCQLGAARVLSTHNRRDVYDPPVLYPHAGTVWFKGQRHNVTWDVSNPPPYIINPIGRIFLRKGDVTTPLILEANFDIMLGRIEVT
ncbi:hypothetical protein C8T65DRAFT_258500 [Cerioporus squamosus]|nr:hypothetical protein C8T65DRAFT_258500 [Cerioporus squamosus]